jgi:hypothetical protein
MDRSEQLNELAAALAKAQATFADAPKSREGQARGGKYKYATLGDIWDACRESLTANGLSVSQFALPSEPGCVLLTTMLLHSSGQFISGTESIPVTGELNPQTYGSAMTYARRYGLAAIVGVVTDDDDAQSVSQSGQRPQQQQRPQASRQPEQRPESSGDRTAAGQGARAAETQPSFPGATGAAEQCAVCFAPAGKPHRRDCANAPKPPSSGTALGQL